MLAVFDKTVPHVAGSLVDDFCSARKGAVAVNLGASGAIAYSSEKQNPLYRGPYPADQVVRDLRGKFAFILYDSLSKATFIAADADESVPFFWGTDSDGRLVLSDDSDTIKKGCGKSFAPFPKGCFFTTSGGLQSYEHPLNALKPMPRVDSQGQVCGSTFKVDESSKKESTSGMRKVDSAANWSGHY
ncbi:unnamed protein product [Spirodela intermedia]|uniref:DUF3700 domain-containing protein n=1 Tax=Spirodela intermedia TaxID=51605 RepID=A0A7I8J007_SPIIN|nr:unnamed protein product [Spirodela intermedia]CAA6662751.1 unnamed protein product [Spirodela intermedia]